MENFNGNPHVDDFPGEAAPPQGVSLEMPSKSFGEMLLQARMDANLSLAEASRKARVSLGSLQSLEAGDFSRINVNSIYCRSIIERLCNAYGTTPDATEAIKDNFDQGLSHYQIETGVETSYETMRESLDDSEPGQRRRPAAIIISIIILGLVGLAAFSYIFNSCQYRRTSNADTDYDLPSLIAPPRLPLDEMKVPQ